MSVLNNDRILNGTPEKRLMNAYNTMKKNYTEESANEFSKSYMTESLSFILDNSNKIFSEPYVGYGFYKDIITECAIPPKRYGEELNKVTSYIKEAARLGASHEQMEMYEELKDILTEKSESIKNTAQISSYACERGAEDYINAVYDAVYESERTDDDILLTKTFESVCSVNDPYTFFSIATDLHSRYPENTGSMLYGKTREFHKKYSPDMEESQLRTTLESVIAMSTIKGDSYATESLNMCENVNMKYNWYGIMTESVDTYVSLIEAGHTHSHLEYIPVGNIRNAMNRILTESTSELELGELRREKYQKLCHTQVALEVLTEKAKYDGVDYEALDQNLCAVESEILALEWEDDGTCNSVIANHARTSRERKYNMDGIPNKKEEPDKEDDEDDDKKKDDDKEKNVSEAGEDNEQKSDENQQQPSSEINTNVQPVKPKEDLATKIQNKALDHDAKRKQKEGIRNEKLQKLNNAKNAILAGPKGWWEGIQNFQKKFDKMDENRRKEFFLKPGYRHKIFKNLKLAIMYGAVANIKLTLIPVTMLIRHFDKDKDRRIRNELSLELESEIKVCDEKIKDADSKGDNQEKYKLMRIKDKLEAELTRVRLNSKMI